MNILFGIGEGAINALLINIVSLIYELVAVVFEIFVALARVKVLESEAFQTLVSNFYLVLGVGMLFVIAFAILKSMINIDDNKGTEASTKIVKNFITSLLIMIFLPTIFRFAFAFQSSVIEYNTIGKIFWNTSSSLSTDSTTISTAGNSMANTVFLAFFVPNTDSELCNNMTISECKQKIENDDGTTLDDTINSVDKNGNFSSYANYASSVSDGSIKFNILLSLAAGCFLIYVVFSFCLDLGLRLVKLYFYQIIAPIPVMFRVVPNSKISETFNSWVKVTVTCYLEVFLRLIIIYFGVALVSMFKNGDFLSKVFDNTSGIVGLVCDAIVILSIVTFIKQAPKLIGEVIGIDSSNMKLGIREKLKDGGLFAAGAAVGGLIASKGSVLSGARGFKHGWNNTNFQNIGAEAKRRQEKMDARSAGITWKDELKDRGLASLGFGSRADIKKSEIEDAAYDISNDTSETIEYTMANGEVITLKPGESRSISAADIAAMEAKKAENIREIAKSRDKVSKYDGDLKMGNELIQLKSNLKSEAEKKIDEEGSKETFDLEYIDENGQKKIFKGTYAQIKHFKNNDLTVEQRQQVMSDEKIRDAMIEKFIDKEASKASSKTRKDLNLGFQSLENKGGYDIHSFEYEKNADGSYKRDKDGNMILSKDEKGNKIVKEEKVHVDVEQINGAWRLVLDRDSDGKIKSDTIEMKSKLAELEVLGLVKYDKTKNCYEDLTEYGLSKGLDGLAKVGDEIISIKKQNIQQKDIDGLQSKNDTMDAISKQFNDMKEAELKSQEMRRLEASKAYSAKKNDSN